MASNQAEGEQRPETRNGVDDDRAAVGPAATSDKRRQKLFNRCSLAATVILFACMLQLGCRVEQFLPASLYIRRTDSFVEEEAQQRNRSNDAGMTVLITTYKQPRCLKMMIRQLRTCSKDLISEIRVNWFEGRISDPPYEQYSSQNFTSHANNESFIPVRFDLLPDKLSHRFAPRDFVTDAIFSVDVDTYYSCEALQLAYDTWLNWYRTHKRRPGTSHTIADNDDEGAAISAFDGVAVGFHPRLLVGDRVYRWDESYYGYPENVRNFNYNTLFLTKGGIVHKDMFQTYFSESYTSFRQWVDKHITGEDILMSYILSTPGIRTGNESAGLPRQPYFVRAICLEEEHNCPLDCKENKVDSLVVRTSHHRWAFIQQLYEHFRIHRNDFANSLYGGNTTVRHSAISGASNPFELFTKEGATNMVWQSHPNLQDHSSGGNVSLPKLVRCDSNPTEHMSAHCKDCYSGGCPSKFLPPWESSRSA